MPSEDNAVAKNKKGIWKLEGMNKVLEKVLNMTVHRRIVQVTVCLLYFESHEEDWI